MLEVSEKSGRPEEQIALLLERVPSEEIWRDIQRAFDTDLVCAVTISGDNQGFTLSRGILERLAKLKVDVSFEVWAELEENDDEAAGSEP